MNQEKGEQQNSVRSIRVKAFALLSRRIDKTQPMRPFSIIIYLFFYLKIGSHSPHRFGPSSVDQDGLKFSILLHLKVLRNQADRSYQFQTPGFLFGGHMDCF